MKDIVLNNRIINKDDSPHLLNLEHEKTAHSHYLELKKRLKQNLKKEIYYKLDNILILKEIKDNEYYKIDGYKNFESFIKDYRLAKSQVYLYLRLADAVKEGFIEEKYIIEHGINKSIEMVKNKKQGIEESKQNPLKPLRFQLKNEESYNFYKKHAKFAAYLLDSIFSNKQELLQEFLNEFENLKSKKGK
ncbi:permease (plasmid) [Borrelia turcica IST7]|uniref:Permease n=1 Tax=Borrelia turcica IST7 TaxID=1104446 RepID=A0A386PQH6_9SPIR|nr:chromosome replication/partitioning protein [Borrelia turcica]AYE36957.1 permease [Borrelia turcica IST7]